jgi:hypothetical protein
LRKDLEKIEGEAPKFLYRFSKIMREIEGRNTALPCPYKQSISIEILEKWYYIKK